MLPPLPYLPCSLQGVLLPKEGYLILRGASRLDAFSVYPFQTWLLCHAVGRQQIHQWSVHPGPLVLRTAPLKYPPPAPDRDRTVSRRSEPSSRTALMGEQPSFGGVGGVSLPDPVSVTGCSGVFVVLSSAISIYLLFFGMKKGAQLFSQAPVGSSSFLRHDTKIPPVVSFGRYFV